MLHGVGDDVGLWVGIGIVGLCDGLNVGDDDGTVIVGLYDGLNVGDVGNDGRLTDLIDDVNGINDNDNIITITRLHRCIDSNSRRNKVDIITKRIVGY